MRWRLERMTLVRDPAPFTPSRVINGSSSERLAKLSGQMVAT